LFVVGVVLVALLASQGGYFAPSWGWSSLLLLLTIGVCAILSDRVGVGRTELGLLAPLGALAGWIALSAIWSDSVGSTVLEAERAVLYLSVAGTIIMTARRRDVDTFLLVVLGAISLVGIYALCTRCWPDRFSVASAVAGYRLSTPIGYWNGLGIVATMGVVLALGFLAGSRSLGVRATASVVCVPLIVTLYFTFSRASWIALGFGILASLVAARSRLRLVAWGAIGAVAPGLALLYARTLDALASANTSLTSASREGRNLALAVLGLSVLATLLVLAGAVLERRLDLSRRTRSAVGIALTVAALCATGFGLAEVGHTPRAVISRAYHSFEVPTPTIRGRIDQRLFSFSGNGRIELWQTAWRDYRRHPWLGSGAGTYERAWLANPKAGFKVSDAHSLYVETIAELGPVGLGLLLTAFLLPLVLTIRRGARPAVAGATGAYVAYLVHAGVDWDWELAGVTSVAIALGSLLLIHSRPEEPAVAQRRARGATVAAAVGLSVVAGLGYLGNSASAIAENDLQKGRFDRAASEALRARRLMPWSAAPLILLGEAQLGRGDLAAARDTLLRALAKDRGDWETWLDLALASSGSSRARALDRASSLYPRSIEVASVRARDRSVRESVRAQARRRRREGGRSSSAP
jgi:hypothetical protein